MTRINATLQEGVSYYALENAKIATICTAHLSPRPRADRSAGFLHRLARAEADTCTHHPSQSHKSSTSSLTRWAAHARAVDTFGQARGSCVSRARRHKEIKQAGSQQASLPAWDLSPTMHHHNSVLAHRGSVRRCYIDIHPTHERVVVQ